MPDDQEPEEPVSGEDPGAGKPKGIMVSLAVILIAILVLLVVFMNLSGQGATGATVITENPWSLQSFTAPDGTITPVLNGTVINATFRTDGQLAGSGGCNGYSARYMVQDTLIVVSRVTTTSMGCWDNNASLQEEQYYGSLEDAYELRVHDRVLTIFGSDGKPLLVFTPAQPEN
jgi:heat shock protein HslJ